MLVCLYVCVFVYIMNSSYVMLGALRNAFRGSNKERAVPYDEW